MHYDFSMYMMWLERFIHFGHEAIDEINLGEEYGRVPLWTGCFPF